ncbi:MAG TPA: hypothetical protein VM717_11360 [Chthoniobacterales bacterium]|jgi:hypothetical protein|nr:hypothetical protein [Chthoniobacterales bacterium]
MTELTIALPLTLAKRPEQIFPTLTEAQVARIAAHGRKRRVKPGKILLDVGDNLRFFGWRPQCRPHLLETSLPDVFVVSDGQ